METTNTTQRSNKMNPVATGLAGMVIGAGITAAGVAMLRDKQTRQKVKTALKTAGGRATKYFQELKSEGKKQTEKGMEKIHETIKEVKKEPKKAL